MSVRQIWKIESEERLDHIHLLAGERGILISSGSKTMFLDEAGLKRWTVSLKGRVVGFGFSPQEDAFSIAYENGIRLVNRIGVTMKEIPLASSPVDFAVSDIAAVLTEKELLAFSREGRELWKVDSGGKHVTCFRGRVFVGGGKNLTAFSKAGRCITEAEFPDAIVALASGRESLFVVLRHRLLSVTEDCDLTSERSLDDSAFDLSADEYVAVLHPHKVVLYDESGEERWLLRENASAVSTKGSGVAVAAGKQLSYHEEIGEGDILYEIMCRGDSRCGTFVSSSYIRQCPKCRSTRIMVRVIRRGIN
ncbi:MAG: hypothetical protein V3V91_08215 [Thermoplasmata archaeon]